MGFGLPLKNFRWHFAAATKVSDRIIRLDFEGTIKYINTVSRRLEAKDFVMGRKKEQEYFLHDQWIQRNTLNYKSFWFHNENCTKLEYNTSFILKRYEIYGWPFKLRRIFHGTLLGHFEQI